MRQSTAGDEVPTAKDRLTAAAHTIRQQYLGRLGGQHCYSLELTPKFTAGPDEEFRPLRQTFGKIPELQFAIAGLAYQVVEWDRTHQFCGCCGAKTEALENERAKRCPGCGLTNYPRLAPAVIVRVSRDDQLLLSRSPHFPEGMYSVQAGFVEPGETLEEAVAREVAEEVGIKTGNIKYFGSQPWPFPNSLMIGFTADYAGGELKVNRDELEDARWFSANELPRISSRMSIARRLIDAFAAE